MASLICGSRIDSFGLVARRICGSGEGEVSVPATVRTVVKSRRQSAKQGRGLGAPEAEDHWERVKGCSISLSSLEARGNCGLGSCVNGNEQKQLVSEHNGGDREAKRGARWSQGQSS